jgi:hypothetical protein
MSATARLVVQMTPSEKSALVARARRARISTAEFVRPRIGDDTLDGSRDEIKALLTTLEATAPTILRSLDSAVATVASAHAVLDDLASGSKERTWAIAFSRACAPSS